MNNRSEKSAKDYAGIARRITVTLSATRALVSAAFIASGTISVMVAAQLSGNPAWAGLATSVQQLATAFAALAVAMASEHIGRRSGLALGLAVGAVGAALAVGSILAGSLPFFLGGAVLLGVASAGMHLGRFAAAEVHPPGSRGQAISSVVAGGAVGAIVGPLLIGPSGRGAEQAGLSALAGPYLVTVAGLALASLVIYVWMRPDPRDIGRELAERYTEGPERTGPTRTVATVLRTPAATVAVSSMIVGQAVMAMLTGIVGLHMADHQHSLSDISLVASAHTFGMFAFSVVAGRLTDRWGRGPVIVTGTALLALSCVLATLSPDVLPLAIALFLLGVGWNFSYVAGSALLSDQLSLGERATTQGASDLLVGLATAAASLGSGLVFARTGYSGVGIAGTAASLVPVMLTAWWMARMRGRRIHPAAGGGCQPQSVARQALATAAMPASCQL